MKLFLSNRRDLAKYSRLCFRAFRAKLITKTNFQIYISIYHLPPPAQEKKPSELKNLSQTNALSTIYIKKETFLFLFLPPSISSSFSIFLYAS
jgi:hypothetical protein